VVPVNRTAGVGGVIDELRSFRTGKRLGGIQLKDLISEGRE
jgi:predicted nucleic acid-binding protein